jgi:hypothetical protein
VWRSRRSASAACGFLPLDAGEASLLFEVVFRRYERGSIVLTSNKSYGEWGEVFSGDTVIATAILDRLLHHSTTISIKGESYRLKDRKRPVSSRRRSAEGGQFSTVIDMSRSTQS